MKTNQLKKSLLISWLLFLLPIFAIGQFNSGSTGANGALDLSAMNCPNNVCEISLPESGILNYTTVNIPNGKVLTFRRNMRNTPVIILAQGNVTISGTISLNADNYFPGPGGFYGGQPSLAGFGPGGGSTNSNPHGRWVGALSLSPIVGGSGGFGATCSYYGACPGGGGGGAILIASSASITITPNSLSNANIAANGSPGDVYNGRGSVGSGGAIRLVSNTLNITGTLSACGGLCGVVRMEATQGQINFTGYSNPPATIVPFTAGNIPTITTNAQPQLTIASVGGYAVPSYAGSRFDTVDLLLPNNIPDPVNVVVQGVNIPAGTQVQVGFVSGSPNGTSSACTLSGGPGPLSCTATISNLNRIGVTYLLATAVFAPPEPLAQYNPKGKDQVATVRLETILGKAPKYIFLRSDKTPIDVAKVPKPILQYFGM